MSQSVQTTILIILPLLLQLAGLVFAVLVDSYISRKNRKLLIIIAVLVFSLIIQNLVDFAAHGEPDMARIRTVADIYGYAVRPVVLVLFMDIVGTHRKHTVEWILVIANAAVYMTALFSGISFRISPVNGFERGPLGYTCHVISFIFLGLLIADTVRETNWREKGELFIPIGNASVIVAAVIVDMTIGSTVMYIAFLTVAVVSSCVFYYIWLHLQFVREHEQALLAEQRIQVMKSQIQPHFLFNTLSTIQALCRTDPEKAFHTIEKFGQYLRQNIDSLDQSDLIPFERELEHTRIYAEIEMIRFPSITVEYNISDNSFDVPALTVQPIVENAIRHGIRVRKNGIVSVSTFRTEDDHVIVIKDNGKGFDTEAAANADGTHIGIQNVRERVEKICGGSLDIESVPGKGTTVTIKIPV